MRFKCYCFLPHPRLAVKYLRLCCSVFLNFCLIHSLTESQSANETVDTGLILDPIKPEL